MAHLERRQFIVDGKPQLVLSGEIHYFRLEKKDWIERIQKAKRAGCNCIASYIPWVYHQETENSLDLTGRTAPERNLAAFIDICKEYDLWFIARPGPFTMGEMINEGIPDWIYDKCPDAIPTTWGGKKVTSKTLNYLDPSFLKEVRKWYAAVMPILAPRQDTKGGNVIALQLDNEIGMLQCWTEEADLSEQTLCEFTQWVQTHRNADYQKHAYPFDISNPMTRQVPLQDGSFESARMYHSDYTEFTRDRFARYANELRKYAKEGGVDQVPYIINIHGSGGGRATTYPIGISQTYKAFNQDKEFWASSDHYLGDITRQNAQDMHFLNAFTACVCLPDQPISSVEFEAGSGDYGEVGTLRYPDTATDFKARMSVMQGNRMLNHYLLAGGHNPKLSEPRGDGQDRFGTTGQRHGFAAPIGPEGSLDPTYFGLWETNHTLLSIQQELATMNEEFDAIALGFIPDYYSTDVKRPGPTRQLADKLESARGFLEGVTRAMLDQGLAYPAINLQAEIPKDTKCLVLACCEVLHREIQERLMQFVKDGGSLFLYGKLPVETMEGEPCRILIDALGIEPQPTLQGSQEFFPSLRGVGVAKGEPDVRVWQVQPFTMKEGEAFHEVIQRNYFAGAFVPHGKGLVCIATSEIHYHRSLWKAIFDKLGVKPRMTHNEPMGGILLNAVSAGTSSRVISVINLDTFDKHITLVHPQTGKIDLHLAARSGKFIPFNLTKQRMKILASTTELGRVEEGRLGFRTTKFHETVWIAGEVKLEDETQGSVRTANGASTIKLAPGGRIAWVVPSQA